MEELPATRRSRVTPGSARSSASCRSRPKLGTASSCRSACVSFAAHVYSSRLSVSIWLSGYLEYSNLLAVCGSDRWVWAARRPCGAAVAADGPRPRRALLHLHPAVLCAPRPTPVPQQRARREGSPESQRVTLWLGRRLLGASADDDHLGADARARPPPRPGDGRAHLQPRQIRGARLPPCPPLLRDSLHQIP